MKQKSYKPAKPAGLKRPRIVVEIVPTLASSRISDFRDAFITSLIGALDFDSELEWKILAKIYGVRKKGEAA